MDAFSYLDVPRSGVMNMAIDDALLEFAERQQAFVLRVYEWSEPTLSLGYFQKLDDRFLHPPGQDLSVVRRATGGGAIVHHHDLTYSLCIPQSRSSVGAAPAIYESVHGSLVTWLRELRVPAEQWRRTAGEDDSAPTTASPARPVGDDFLCFRRRSSGDVVAAGHKILGSAQRRSKGALLQHGSLLLATSEYAPSLCGLSQLSPNAKARLASRRHFAQELMERIATAIDSLASVRFKCGLKRGGELEEYAASKVAKFSNSEWLSRT